ncbi:MAG: ABC transporter permease [Bacteroidaceae bacterium]|nr:ABC transporter permease [Bacteroidaceae bacterium]
MNNKEHTSFFNLSPLGGSWRRGNLWLFLELIIITVVAWVVFDPAIVNLYCNHLPMGYDNECLLYAEAQLDVNDPYQEVSEERKTQLLRQLKSMEGVENVYLSTNPYSSLGNYNPSYQAVKFEQDTVYLASVSFVFDANFFETYGIKPLPGSPSAEELSQIQMRSDQAVLTRQAAISLFGTEDVVGRHFQNLLYGQDPVEMTVAGVVEDVQMSVARSIRSLIFTPIRPMSNTLSYVIRLQNGIHPKRFIEEHGKDLTGKGKTEFSRIKKLMTYDDHLKQMELSEGRPQEVNRSIALALFFLLNLCLAVIGTVWLQAKRRTEECGVRRAYGATKPRLLLSFLVEGALLATIACGIGGIIYLNYAYSGLEVENGIESFDTMYVCDYYMPPADRIWVDHFWPHFFVLSAVVYLIILCTVLIGTAIPAIKIINTRITNSLKE